MLQYLLATTLCMLGFYAFYQIFLVKDTFFQRNRFYLLITILLSLVIPLVKWSWFSMTSENMLSQTLGSVQVGISNLNEKVTTSLLSVNYIMVVYVFIILLLLLRLGVNFTRLVKFIKKVQVQHFPSYHIVETEGKLPTFSFLGYIFWDNSQKISQEAQDKILLHETIHVKDKHTYDLLFMEVMQILFWCNPMFYFYKKALKDQHEFIADRAVLHETDKKVYSKLIVQTVFKNLNLPLSHSFNQTQVKKRLRMMHKIPTPDYKTFRVLWSIPLFLTFVFLSANVGVNAEDKEVYRYAKASEGMDAFYKSLQNKVQYPSEAKQQKLEGKVYMQFTVTKDGEVKDIGIQRSTHDVFNQAALDAFYSLETTWKPAIVDGKLVSQRLTIPVVFKLPK